MESPKESAKDPATGVGLSLLMPGLGHLYAGEVRSFAIFLALEIWLYSSGWFIPLFLLHVFQAVAARGAVNEWNLKHGFTSNVIVPPPPPARGSRGRTAPTARGATSPTSPAPSAPSTPSPSPSPAALDADAFLAELQDAWREHRTGGFGARHFADRKWKAIRAVVVESREDGEALVEAARDLAAAGVLTSEEIGQLAAKVGAE